ncbi:MAG TPA: dihydroneopterin aldolase [Miltoncostaeaceae bacterium]|nr:dihydroneopterin aldolase [Miltoncostaeaceae bacterium]
MSGGGLTVRLRRLEAFGRHGVLPEEQALGQRFVVDLDIELRGDLASRTDELIDTVDYASLADAVCALVSGPPVALLERLAGMIADLVLEEPWARAVTVTVRKPHVALPHPLRESAVTLRRAAAGGAGPLGVARLVAAALDAGDGDALAAIVSDDVEVADAAGAVFGRGREAARAWLAEAVPGAARIERDGAERLEAGRAVAPIRAHLGDGTELRLALAVDVRDGRAMRLAVVAGRAAGGP